MSAAVDGLVAAGAPVERLAWVAAHVGRPEQAETTVAEAIGRFGGRTLVDRVGKYILLTHKDLDRAEAWFARRGEPVVLFGRFIPLLRSFVSFASGLGEMALPKFAIFTLIGCAVWCTALCSLGYSLGREYQHVLNAFSFAGYVLGALAVVAVAFVIWHRVRQLRRERDLGQADEEV